MATLHADGTITDTPRCLEGPSCCGAVFQIRATYTQLLSALAETDTVEDAEPFWVVRVWSGDERPTERVSIHHASIWPRENADTGTLWYVTSYPEGRWAAERLAMRLNADIIEL
ncbi:hypothetical protein [Nocardia brasiliensis]|uniref:hypothetical protein n=1 Tax=Nocardia brasiliensis TaxID=37326 RepID=UPI002455EA45|nr:hypothetical protein [Nocardia brasiliensis]